MHKPELDPNSPRKQEREAWHKLHTSEPPANTKKQRTPNQAKAIHDGNKRQLVKAMFEGLEKRLILALGNVPPPTQITTPVVRDLEQILEFAEKAARYATRNKASQIFDITKSTKPKEQL